MRVVRDRPWVVRDRWGDKWVRRGNRAYEPFRWSYLPHAFAYVARLGRIPDGFDG